MISNLAIRRPVTTGMFFIGIGMLGVVSLGRLNVELMPEVVFPQIFVVATQPTLSPEQVERDLVMPVEEEIGKLENVVQIDSQSPAPVSQLLLAPRLFDQNPPHRLGRRRKEVAATVPILALRTDEPKIRFVDESGGLQGLPRLLLGQLLGR